MSEKFASGRPNILVTGGAGFVGSHLCDELVKFANVVAFDNFITSEESNIDLLLQHPNFEFIRHDVIIPFDPVKLPELRKFQVEVQGFQEIYHLACPTSPKEYQKIPIETLLANSHGTKNVLDLAVKFKAKFLQVSTSAIYGAPVDNLPIKEDYLGMIDPIGPRSAYNEGKRFAESLVVNYRERYKIDAKIIRMFNTYGPRMRLDDGRMIPDFVRASLNNEPINVYGDENSVSTFCYVSDMVDAMIKMMASRLTGPVNLGHHDPFPVKLVAEKIIALTGSSSQILFKEHLPYTVQQGIPDTSLAKSRLGWLPVATLDKGLETTIEYMRAHSRLYGIHAERKD
jgi:UDP-glucuronate decarboxylase